MSLPSTKALTRRQVEIVDWLRQRGRVTVDDLATHFAVTPQTIRRDLSDAQMVVRVHGGLSSPPASPTSPTRRGSSSPGRTSG